MKITYDPSKRQKTREERGLDFEEAPLVFTGKHFTREDDRRDYGETRLVTVGMLRGNGWWLWYGRRVTSTIGTSSA
ncbi:BrnT family toxin [Acidithiobacillus thiooxidans]|uniref:BrnT family toxin n=1 Tax=Acidithiobacillus thiooxidans TaxID=930 RepID=UPI001B307F32|nr:BrnT family toxin [Acidithiobacillus thiooxidans]MDX5934925.1 BrnT family toxin [Acidithiobacillus thiooxidans]